MFVAVADRIASTVLHNLKSFLSSFLLYFIIFMPQTRQIIELIFFEF